MIQGKAYDYHTPTHTQDVNKETIYLMNKETIDLMNKETIYLMHKETI